MYRIVTFLSILFVFQFSGLVSGTTLVHDTKQDFSVTGSIATGVKFTDDGWVVIDTITAITRGYSELSNSGGGDWFYRRKITVNNQLNPLSLSDFQVRIALSTSTFVYDGKTNIKGSDIRFVDSDGVNELPHWTEVWNSSGESRVWVKISTIAAQAQKDIYMYYGNSFASSVSSGTAVFDFFDDFEDGNFDGWDIIWGGSGWSVTNNVLSYQGSLGSTINRPVVKVGNLITTNAVLEAKGMFSSPGTGSSNQLTFLFRLLENNTSSYSLECTLNEIYFAKWKQGYLNNVPSNLVLDRWYTFSIKYSASNLRAYCDNNLIMSSSLTNVDYISGTIGLGGYSSNNLNFDDVRIRKYTNIEPVTNIGDEENVQQYTAVYESPYYNVSSLAIPIEGIWQTIYSSGIQPSGTELKLQIATNNDDKISPVFRGPDGNPFSYYTLGSTQTIYSGLSPARYLKYKIIFTTNNLIYIPELDKIQIILTRPQISGLTENIQIAVSSNIVDGAYLYITTYPVSTSSLNTMEHQLRGNLILKQVNSKIYSISGYQDDNTPLVLSDSGKGIDCSFSLTDTNNDGYLDGTLIKTNLLNIFYFDNENQKWLPVTGQVQENKQIKFSINKLPAVYTMLAYQQQNTEVVSGLFNYPNPFSSAQGTTFTYQLTKDAKITVRIYNLTGDLVRKMEFAADSSQGKSIQGTVNSFSWNGYNDVGMKVANGAYLCELIAEPVDGSSKKRITRKIAVLE